MNTMKGNALDTQWDSILNKATIIFMNNVCYDATLEQELLKKYKIHLKDGTRVITMKEIFPRCDPTNNPERWKGHPVTIFNYPWEIQKLSKKHAVSWTSAPVCYYVYTVNRGNNCSIVNESLAMNGNKYLNGSILVENDGSVLRNTEDPDSGGPQSGLQLDPGLESHLKCWDLNSNSKYPITLPILSSGNQNSICPTLHDLILPTQQPHGDKLNMSNGISVMDKIPLSSTKVLVGLPSDESLFSCLPLGFPFDLIDLKDEKKITNSLSFPSNPPVLMDKTKTTTFPSPRSLLRHFSSRGYVSELYNITGYRFPSPEDKIILRDLCFFQKGMNRETFDKMVRFGCHESPVHEKCDFYTEQWLVQQRVQLAKQHKEINQGKQPLDHLTQEQSTQQVGMEQSDQIPHALDQIQEQCSGNRADLSISPTLQLVPVKEEKSSSRFSGFQCDEQGKQQKHLAMVDIPIDQLFWGTYFQPKDQEEFNCCSMQMLLKHPTQNSPLVTMSFQQQRKMEVRRQQQEWLEHPTMLVKLMNRSLHSSYELKRGPCPNLDNLGTRTKAISIPREGNFLWHLDRPDDSK
eukprot:TRINITY_DN4416_c0_g1_i3.p1 TRINITY_DN4416_c0_g1~~TRINITY_DN4416_c0_g1_i3.p1  ORF type:complete len:575 (+),score=123.38 TRINITY_DN4416_c0_g1_i3:784-2508(+)